MWFDQAEWVGSRKRHVTGFRLVLYFEHNYKISRISNQTPVNSCESACTLDLCIINQALATSVWFKIYIYIYVENEIKRLEPVTCRYRLLTHFCLISSHICVEERSNSIQLHFFVCQTYLPQTSKCDQMVCRSEMKEKMKKKKHFECFKLIADLLADL